MAGDKPSGDADKALAERLAPDGLAARLQAALGALTLDDGGGQRPKQSYAFWGTQPVAQFDEQPSSGVRSISWIGRLPPPPAAACRPLPAASAGSIDACLLHTCPTACPQLADGAIDKPKTVADVRQEPYGLPQK